MLTGMVLGSATELKSNLIPCASRNKHNYHNTIKTSQPLVIVSYLSSCDIGGKALYNVRILKTYAAQISVSRPLRRHYFLCSSYLGFVNSFFRLVD